VPSYHLFDPPTKNAAPGAMVGGSVAVKLEDVGGTLAPDLVAYLKKGAGSPKVRPTQVTNH
jgi:hypothetical protein